MIDPQAFIFFGIRYLKTVFRRNSVFFLFLTPTRKCNMTCKYCYQKDIQSGEMSLSDFVKLIPTLRESGTGFIVFSGGEPLLWEPLHLAIKVCSILGIWTSLVTNGKLLTKERIDQLSASGLTYLVVSLDSVRRNSISPKNLENNPELLELLEYAKYRSHLFVSCNAVLTRLNVSDIQDLVQVLTPISIPLSVGFIDVEVGHPQAEERLDFLDDRASLRGAVSKIIQLKKQGYWIIEPDEYFLNYEKQLDGEVTWYCRKPNGRSLAVSPTGDLLACTRINKSFGKMKTMTTSELMKVRRKLKELVQVCNSQCYANCSYDSDFFKLHPLYLLKNIFWLDIKNSMKWKLKQGRKLWSEGYLIKGSLELLRARNPLILPFLVAFSFGLCRFSPYPTIISIMYLLINIIAWWQFNKKI